MKICVYEARPDERADLEQQAGMTRANIRYYEQEGLLSPVRRENGYRDYSQEDLDTLLRIKLFLN